MKTKMKLALLAAILLLSTAFLAFNQGQTPVAGAEYTSDNRMKYPEKYREWVYLTTGFDMSYSANAMDMGHHMFDNVFVNPAAYKVYMETGTWPEGTVMVLEARKAEGRGSINQKGNYQSTDTMGFEVHVKDSRFPGKWAFVGFDESKLGTAAPRTGQSAGCYTCHEEHGAVDTTFVQFYPTLLPVAKSKGTLASSYVKESAAPAPPQK